MKQKHTGEGDIVAGSKITNINLGLGKLIFVVLLLLICYLAWIYIKANDPHSILTESDQIEASITHREFENKIPDSTIDYFDDIQDLSTEKIGDNPIGLVFKDGKTRFGSLVETHNLNFEKDSIGFIDYTKKEEFMHEYNRSNINNKELDLLMDFFARKDILKYEIPESRIQSISLSNGAKPPDFFTITVLNEGKPGHVNVKYQIYGNPKWFTIGDLRIINSNITLPLKLAYVSYSETDKKVVEETLIKLNDNGILTWYDQKELKPGDSWENKIINSIQTSDCVLIFLSKKSINERGYFNKEINLALSERSFRPENSRYIIPILIDDVNIPNRLKEFYPVKLWKEKSLEKLYNVLIYPEYRHLRNNYD